MVAHHIRVVEDDELDAFDVAQDVLCLHEAGVLVAGQVDLGDVAGDEELGVFAHTGKEHLELALGGVLCLVEDDVSIVEGTAAHEGEWRDLDGLILEVGDEFGHRHHIAEGVVEGLEVRIEFVAHVAGQEAEVLTGLHRRTGQDDALHLLVFQRPHGEGHRCVGLAGACRPDGENHVVVLQTLHQLFLVGRERLDDLPFPAVQNHIRAVLLLVEKEEMLVLVGGDVQDVGLGEAFEMVVEGGEQLEARLEGGHLLVGTVHLQLVATGGELEGGIDVAEQVDVAVVLPVDADGEVRFDDDYFLHGLLFFFDEALSLQLNLLIVVGDEVAPRIFPVDVTDDGDFALSLDGFVVFLLDGEKKLVVLAAVEGDGGGHNLELPQRVEGELGERNLILVDGAAETVVLTEQEQCGGDAFGDGGHGGGHHVELAEGLDDVGARLGFELPFEEVLVALEMGLAHLGGLEDLFLALQQQQTGVGGTEIAGGAYQLVLCRAGATHEAVGLHLSDSGDADGQSRGRRGDVEPGDVEVIVVAAGAHTRHKLLNGLDGEAVGDGQVEHHLMGHGVHRQDVGDRDGDALEPQMLEGEIGEVEMDVLHKKFVGGHREEAAGAGGGRIVADAGHRRFVGTLHLFGKMVDEVVLAQLGNLVSDFVICHIISIL